jgi:hypothetical protein
MERIKEMGIIKMNDYLSTGTRQQFWEEYYVKVVMQVSKSLNLKKKMNIPYTYVKLAVIDIGPWVSRIN